MVSFQYDFPLIHDTKTIDKLGEKFKIMFDDDDDFLFRNNFIEQIDNLSFQLWRDTSRWFVEQIYLSFLQVKSRNFQQSHLSAAQISCQLILLFV